MLVYATPGGDAGHDVMRHHHEIIGPPGHQANERKRCSVRRPDPSACDCRGRGTAPTFTQRIQRARVEGPVTSSDESCRLQQSLVAALTDFDADASGEQIWQRVRAETKLLGLTHCP
jgi:hypothetical protein